MTNADLQKRFDACVKFINTTKPGDPNAMDIDNMMKLEFYAIYKQATVGDCTGKRPGMMNIVARYKYDAWKKLTDKKTTKDQAKELFCKRFREAGPKQYDIVMSKL